MSSLFEQPFIFTEWILHIDFRLRKRCLIFWINYHWDRWQSWTIVIVIITIIKEQRTLAKSDTFWIHQNWRWLPIKCTRHRAVCIDFDTTYIGHCTLVRINCIWHVKCEMWNMILKQIEQMTSCAKRQMQHSGRSHQQRELFGFVNFHVYLLDIFRRLG